MPRKSYKRTYDAFCFELIKAVTCFIVAHFHRHAQWGAQFEGSELKTFEK